MQDISLESLPNYYCNGESGRVAVYATELGDAVVVRKLLESCGYELQQSSDKHINQDNSDSQSTEFGAIICHRDGAEVTATRLLSIIKANRIIIFSDCMDEDVIVLLLGHGAHHFFDITQSERILKARLEAALRVHEVVVPEFLEEGDICFDLIRHKVSRAGEPVDLSPKEYELAFYMFSNINRVIDNAELMSTVWSLPPEMDSRRIDTAACRVRKKLRLTPDTGWELKRVRTVGYRLVRSEEDKDTSGSSNSDIQPGDSYRVSTSAVQSRPDQLVCSG